MTGYLASKGLQSVKLLPISAKRKEGIPELKDILSGSRKDKLAESDTTLITNLRHVEALTKTFEALTRVKSGLASGIPTDLVAQDIREALYYIGSIVGEISDNEVLGVIFSRFCIGK